MNHLFLLSLLFHPSLAQTPTPSSVPQSPTDDNDPSVTDRVFFLSLHIIAVAAIGICSANYRYYAPTYRLDAISTVTFYLSFGLIFVIAVYVTYEYQSPDLLLIGATAAAIAFRLPVPRFWSVQARRLHWDTPMWRVREGRIYMRTRTGREKDDGSREYWNGYVYPSRLIDDTEISEIRERDPGHWEKHFVQWRIFVTRGRLGEEAPRRAAMSFRMAYSVPMPAYVMCGTSEFFAVKGALGNEVLATWDITSVDYLTRFPMFQNILVERWVKVEERLHLAYLLHIKLLLYGEKKRMELEAMEEEGGRLGRRMRRREGEWDWMFMASDWLMGELIVEQGGDPVEFGIEDAYARGKIDNNHVWFLLGHSHERVVSRVPTGAES